jgi:hypothetical protein
MREKDVILEGDYGPATYIGLKWVQQISEVWMETWVRDTDGRAVQRGNRIDLMQANQVELEFGDFLISCLLVTHRQLRSTWRSSV